MIFRHLLVAGSLVLAGCAAQRAPLTTPADAGAALAAVDWGKAQRVEVVLKNFEFDPKTVRLQKGHAYELRLHNTASGGHSFDAAEFFRNSAMASGAAASEAQSSGGIVEVPGGKVVQLRLVPLRAGTFPLRCSHPLHADFGMTGQVVVQ